MTTVVPLSDAMDSVDNVAILVVGFVVSFLLASAVGANNVSNIFGTVVGARVLTFTQTYLLSSIFVTIGAVAVGSAITDTIVTGIIDINLYDSNAKLLLLEQIAAMTAGGIWMALATLLKLPVAATHSIIGAFVGAHVTVMGFEGVNWTTLALIASTWLTSPILAGVLAVILYIVLVYTVLGRDNPYDAMLTSLPIWYFFGIFFNLSMISVLNTEWFHTVVIPWYLSVVISLTVATVIALLVWFIVVPVGYKLPKREEPSEVSSLVQSKPSPEELDCMPTKYTASSSKTETNGKVSQMKAQNQNKDEVEDDVESVFKPLLVLSVILSSFAYGSILVSISVAPLISIWNVYYHGISRDAGEIVTPFWMFIYGGIGVSFGFGIAGKGVTETVGERYTPIVPSSAFPMELGATTVILVASNLGIPVSTTQCKVGAIAAVGLYKDRSSVGFRVLRDTLLAWFVTLPTGAALGAGIMALLQLLVAPLI